MIDTISNMLGVIDGSSTLSGCDAEPNLYLDDIVLEYVEEIEE